MKQFKVPGIYHPLKVKIVSQKWLAVLAKDKNIMGFYDPNGGTIYVIKELKGDVRVHTFWHEMGHHIDLIMEDIKDEETRSDLYGSFLMRITKKSEQIIKKLKS